MPTYLLIAWLGSLVLGIILAATVRATDSDREKGDKRIAAVFFIMLSFVIFAALFISHKCSMGLENTRGYLAASSRYFSERV